MAASFRDSDMASPWAFDKLIMNDAAARLRGTGQAVIARSGATKQSRDRSAALAAPGLLTWGFSRQESCLRWRRVLSRMASDPWFEPVCEIWRWAGSASHSVVAFRATAP